MFLFPDDSNETLLEARSSWNEMDILLENGEEGFDKRIRFGDLGSTTDRLSSIVPIWKFKKRRDTCLIPIAPPGIFWPIPTGM